MQKYRIIFHWFLTVFSLLAYPACSQTELLAEADSLFAAKRYEEAATRYQTIFHNGLYSEQMLLKMAFIYEAEESYSKALYFLSVAFTQMPSRPLLQKIISLANKQNVEGYRITDLEYVLLLLRFYRSYFMALVLGILLSLTWLLLRNRSDPSAQKLPAALLLSFSLVGLALINLPQPSYGIAMSTQSYIMQQPAAGADLIGLLPEGYRLKLVEKTDNWYEVEWQGEKRYVRMKNIWEVNP